MTKPTTPAQVRPGPQKTFDTRVRNSTEVSPKAAAQQQRQAKYQALIVRGQRAVPSTKDKALAARMYATMAPKPAVKPMTPVEVSAARVGAIHYGRK